MIIVSVWYKCTKMHCFTFFSECMTQWNLPNGHCKARMQYKNLRSVRRFFVILIVVVIVFVSIMLNWSFKKFVTSHPHSNYPYCTPLLCIFTTFRPGYHKLPVICTLLIRPLVDIIYKKNCKQFIQCCISDIYKTAKIKKI